MPPPAVGEERSEMSHEVSVSRQYEELRTEVELCTTLMFASARSEQLSQDDVDRLLGVGTHARP